MHTVRPPGGGEWPRVSIVTPSYQQGAFLEETIRSVLLQGYPNLEYLVMDGLSKDQTVEIIRKYERWIDGWVSERDRGQAEAINKGFARATGLWVGWQNSDDYYEPGAVRRLVQAAAENVLTAVFYGSVKLVDEHSHQTGAYPTSAFDLAKMFPWANMFNQSMFFHRRIFEAGFAIDSSLHHYIDHDFFWRLILEGFAFEYVPDISACFRLHGGAKGFTQPDIAACEFHDLHKRLYHDRRLPAGIRRLALRSLRDNCVNQFGQSRWDLFDRLSGDLKQYVGWSGLGLRLAIRRLAMSLGTANIQRLKNVMKKVW